MQPLRGKRIVVTRSEEQAPALAERFGALGATPVCFPVIQFQPVYTDAADRAMVQLDAYDWILFTSVNGVRFFIERAPEHWRPASTTKIGAVGSATLLELELNKMTTDFVPEAFTGESLAVGLGNVHGKRILLPRASIGRPEIIEALRENGATVDDVGLYETVTAVPTPNALAQLAKPLDAVTFTSPSSVRNFFKIFDGGKPTGFGEKTAVVCIGPSTAEEAKQFGLTVHAVPDAYTIDGLVEAVVEWFEKKRNSD